MKPELPRISVVVPSFNQGRFLEQCLASILDQEYPAAEVIVMDGGSSDESLDVIRRYQDRLHHWRSAPDGGQAAAIEEGVAHASGDLVAWLNSDDYYCEDALWRVARAWSRHPGAGLYIGNGFRLREEDGALAPFCRRHLALQRRALVEGIDYVLQPATFFSRAAWTAAGGLDARLRFCLDWDLILRVAGGHRAVVVNEFLAVSREYSDTKTATGGWGRVEEIARLTARHSGRDVTPGALYYVAETALALSDGLAGSAARHHLYEVMRSLREGFARECGNSDGFPETGDPQDVVDLPVVVPGAASARRVRAFDPPAISVVTPSYQQARYLRAALDSVLEQGYPGVESIVRDGGSTDGSVDVLREYEPRLASWTSARDRGPAHAINDGLALAKGEVVSWLNSDDLLAEGALEEVGRAFAEHPETDVVYGNALYVDEEGRLAHADHGGFRTGLYYGAFQPLERIPLYWTYVHSVPQPTVFFRRRLLERVGPLDESYHFIFDFELFSRFVAQGARIRKLDRTLAFYRLHADAKTSDWSRFLIELYRFSRPRWPAFGTPEYRATLRSFLNHAVASRFGGRRGWRFWLTAAAAGASAVTGIGNPERLRRLGTRPRAAPRAARQTT